ncbi:TnsA endonuclease N-terminal domain-containing protein [Anaerorhabdus sp.]|uniref:TnsA endonuclease N-terminal domain-containing protein n=1 Tax=Anaerorhabdus sp. TaxID=1872524 RepID=UPI002FC95F57
MRKSVENKLKEGFGTGTGKDYKPFIRVRDISSSGTCSHFVNPYTGRAMELLSQGEMEFALLLLWDLDVIDIREQYPLDLSETLAICNKLDLKHPHNEKTPMTTDFLVTYKGGIDKAYSLKYARENILNRRSKEKLAIEKLYWNQKGIEWQLVFRSDFNPIRIQNIRLALMYFNASSVHGIVSYTKHCVMHRIIEIDMDKKQNYLALSKQVEGEYKVWKKRIQSIQSKKEI